jgi:hypothetical protein
VGIPPYDRNAFGGWADTDRDCLDTRAELLLALSTHTVTPAPNGCRILRGRWNDPYTGRIFLDASDVDIDHLVPLSWAWQRGAWAWSAAQRQRFANDPINLFAVEDRVNQRKGDRGPLDWLPPNTRFHCEYATRFERVLRLYALEPHPQERQAMTAQRARLCGSR